MHNSIEKHNSNKKCKMTFIHRSTHILAAFIRRLICERREWVLNPSCHLQRHFYSPANGFRKQWAATARIDFISCDECATKIPRQCPALFLADWVNVQLALAFIVDPLSRKQTGLFPYTCSGTGTWLRQHPSSLMTFGRTIKQTNNGSISSNCVWSEMMKKGISSRECVTNIRYHQRHEFTYSTHSIMVRTHT